MKRLLVVAILAATAVFGSFADTVSTTLPVYATLIPVLTVTATPIDFGTFQLGDPDQTANGTITVNTAAGWPYTITLDAGQHYGGGWRQVDNGGYDIKYMITKPGGSEWGDSGFNNTYGFGLAYYDVGTGAAQTVTAAGTLWNGELWAGVPAGAPYGLYADMVNVTVYY